MWNQDRSVDYSAHNQSMIPGLDIGDCLTLEIRERVEQ